MTKKYEKYKSSGVEWIGDIPEHWEEENAGYNLELLMGFPADSKLFNFSIGFPLIRIRDLLESKIETFYNGTFPEKYIVKIGDHLIGMDGDYHNVIWINENALLNQRVMMVKTKNKLERKFFYYSIGFYLKIINDLTYATTVKHLSDKDVRKQKIQIPPPLEQQKIASYLDKKSEEINQFIKNRESLINLLEEEKKATITKAVTKGLDKNVKFKNSGSDWLDKIPEHWEFRRLATFGIFSKGSGLPKADLVENGVPAILYGDIYTKYNLKAVNIINHVTEKSSLTSKKIKKGDILFTGSGETKEDIGKCIVYLGDEKVFAGGDIIIFYQKIYDSLFLSYSLNSNLAIDQKIVSSKGEIIVHIYASKLKEIYIPIPPIKEQQEIVAYLDKETQKIDDLKAKYRQEIDLIKEYKERLIYDVVTGKMNVLEH